MSRSKYFSYFLIMLAIIFWGTSFIATKFLLYEITPETIISMRLILGSGLLAVLALLTKSSFKITAKNHGYILLLALIAVFHLWIQVTGLKYTSASNTGWIIGTAPVFMAILAAVIFKEKMKFIQIAGILIALFGVLLLIGKGDFKSISLIENKGDLMVLGSSFTWGVYSMVNKKISLSYSPLMTILFLFMMMAVIIIPFNINETVLMSILNLSQTGWIAILFLGFLCSGAGYVIWAQALKDLDSAKVGAFLYFEPLVAVIAAWLLLNESITALMIISGLVITGGVLLVNKDN